MKQLKISVLFLIVFTILCGMIYPLIVTGAGYIFFRDKASGSFLVKDGAIRGSVLIGQDFTGPEYFHGRPSAAGYDSSLSGGTNLGHTSSKLSGQVVKRAETVKMENNLTDDFLIPGDLLFSSGSGLDPHISVDSALLQVERIAAAGKLEKKYIKSIIELYTERQLPFYGVRYVNVLKLNTALYSMGVTK